MLLKHFNDVSIYLGLKSIVAKDKKTTKVLYKNNKHKKHNNTHLGLNRLNFILII